MADAVPSPGPRLLYVDDDAGLCRLVQRHLSRLGFTVETASSADEGVRRAREGCFDAIALDHYMPGRDGLELLEELRTLPGAPPVIFCTGAEEPRIAVAALKSGAADYVVKDVHGTFIELLAASVAQEITRARLQRERDAAEREVRESRDRLERLAAQQAVLLREMNHRVSNSLQLITSLIDLQARRLEDEGARAMLRQAAERVEAVALLHRRLYTDSRVHDIALDAYLASLVEELSRAHASRHAITVEAEPMRVETDRAVALGLIVNELITNALKYAYPAISGGSVRVTLLRDGELGRVAVEDDGVGFTPERDGARGTGLGSLIIASMARSLGATLDFDAAHRGTRAILRFPVPA